MWKGVRSQPLVVFTSMSRGEALRGIAFDVVACSVAVFLRHPSHALRQVGTADADKDGPFMGEHALFSGAAERSVALGSSGHVEFARDRLHLVEFVRWGVVPESRWQLDDELGCLRSVGRTGPRWARVSGTRGADAASARQHRRAVRGLEGIECQDVV